MSKLTVDKWAIDKTLSIVKCLFVSDSYREHFFLSAVTS
jgi:hypothetical protein